MPVFFDLGELALLPLHVGDVVEPSYQLHLISALFNHIDFG